MEELEELKTKGASVSFEPMGADLGFAYEDPGRVKLSYSVQLARAYRHSTQREGITLSTEEKFEDLNSYISVFAEPDDFKNRDVQKRIGYILYGPASDDGRFRYPATCYIEAAIPKNTFEQLLASARLGRLPSSISVRVEGMHYGGAPDGSDKIWDNKAFPKLAVISISFGSVPLATEATSSDLDRNLYDKVLPPTRSQVNALAEKLDIITIVIKSGLRSLLWAVLVVIVGMLILFFFR